MRLLFSAFLCAALLVAPSAARAVTPGHVIGRILLQVEQNGEAWYVLPDSGDRFYLRDGEGAYAALRTFGLGVTNADLEKIPVGTEERFEDLDTDGDGLDDKLEEALGTSLTDSDTDNDGFSDFVEITSGYNPLGAWEVMHDAALVDRLKGNILLQVESRGEAWYVHPIDGKRYYMKDGAAAYEIMKYLSLGITDTDLATIPISLMAVNCSTYSCIAAAVENDQAVDATVTSTIDVFGVLVTTTSHVMHSYDASSALYHYDVETLDQVMNYSEAVRDNLRETGLTDAEIDAKEANAEAEARAAVIGYTYVCTHDDLTAMTDLLNDLALGNISSDGLDFATCEEIVPR